MEREESLAAWPVKASKRRPVCYVPGSSPRVDAGQRARKHTSTIRTPAVLMLWKTSADAAPRIAESAAAIAGERLMLLGLVVLRAVLQVPAGECCGCC